MSTVAAVVCIAAQTFSCEPMPVRVIDGDTISIRSEKIRILGIDAPEMKGNCTAESLKAREAKDFVAQLIKQGNVYIDREGRDKYGRTLARVSVENQDVGKRLMKEGLARKWEKKWRPGLDDVWCRP